MDLLSTAAARECEQWRSKRSPNLHRTGSIGASEAGEGGGTSSVRYRVKDNLRQPDLLREGAIGGMRSRSEFQTPAKLEARGRLGEGRKRTFAGQISCAMARSEL